MRKTILLFAFFLAPLCAFAQQGNQVLPGGGGGCGTVVSKTGNYTATAGDSGNTFSFNGTNLTLTLPNPPPTSKWSVCAGNLAATALTVSPNGLNLNGGGSITLTTNQGVVLTTDGSNYFYIGGVSSSSGTVTAASQWSIPTYTSAGSASTVGQACSPPTSNGTYSLLYSVTASAAVQPTCPQVGLTARAISGATATDTVLYSDVVGQIIDHDKAGSQAVTVTLPTPTTLGNPNAVFLYTNHSAQIDTITPTTWTIQSNTTAAGASVSVPSGTSCRISVDPFNATNWLADCLSSAVVTSALSGITPATGSNTIANVNNPQTWNWAQTTDSQNGLTFGETSAATNGTLTNGLANQAEHSISTVTNSTATPLNVTQGSITNTVATPLAQFRATWNNSGLHARGFGISVTNTASAADSYPFFVNVGNSMMFGVDAAGIATFNGNAAINTQPPSSALNVSGWKYCTYQNLYCVGTLGFTEFHMIGNGNTNGWISASINSAASNSGQTTPDTNAGASLGAAGGVVLKENACGTNFVNDTGRSVLCPSSTSHEFSAYLNGSTSAGMMVRSQPNANPHLTGQTATKTIYTICAAAAGACNVAGQYAIDWYFNQGGTACGTPGTGGVTYAVTWVDNAGTHTAVALPMDDSSSLTATGTKFTFQTSNTAAWASGHFVIWSTGASDIQVTNTYTACGVGTGTWELASAVTRLQ